MEETIKMIAKGQTMISEKIDTLAKGQTATEEIEASIQRIESQEETATEEDALADSKETRDTQSTTTITTTTESIGHETDTSSSKVSGIDGMNMDEERFEIVDKERFEIVDKLFFAEFAKGQTMISEKLQIVLEKVKKDELQNQMDVNDALEEQIALLRENQMLRAQLNALNDKVEKLEKENAKVEKLKKENVQMLKAQIDALEKENATLRKKAMEAASILSDSSNVPATAATTKRKGSRMRITN